MPKTRKIKDDSKNYVKETRECTKHLVTEFSNFDPVQGSIILMDYYSLSVTITVWALVTVFSIINTMRQD